MPYVTRVLVVASVTSTSDELLEALSARGERSPAKFHLLMPASAPGHGGLEAQRPRLEETLKRWRAAGLDADGEVGDKDPVTAVWEAWDPRAFDEVIVCTLPGDTSKWMQFDLPHRLARMTDSQVTHVVARSAAVTKPEFRPVPDRRSASSGTLDAAFSWAAPKRS